MKEDILNYLKEIIGLHNEMTKAYRKLNKNFKGIKVILNNKEYNGKLAEIHKFDLFENSIEVYYTCDEIIDGEDNICVDYFEPKDFFNGVVTVIN